MRIAQIADLHIKAGGALAYDVADTVSALRSTVRHLNILTPQPDLLLIAGDISDDGTAESYTLTEKLLAPLQMPYYLVPGNHDDKAALAEVFSEHAYLREQNGLGICYTIEDHPLRLIGLDSVIPGQHGGGLNIEQLSWLDETLAAKPEKPTLISLHHPPFASGIGHMDKEPFSLRDELAALLRRHPQVQRVACGHIHRSISRHFGGTLATVCPGIGMQLALELRSEAPSGFRMEPVAVLLHYLHSAWDLDTALLTHLSIVEEPPRQYGSWYPFS